MTTVSGRLLSLLQLTRMALVFTAIADSYCAMLLLAQSRAVPGVSGYLEHLQPRALLAMAGVSISLYGFGMSLNDIIDRRRDERISPTRPLPSGRIGVLAAHVICTFLAISSLVCGAAYASITGEPAAGRMSLLLIIFTGALITFYDYAGKYLVAAGLLTLGLIRFFHAAIAAPQLPLLWHPLMLLNHVAIISTVAYAWEEKRPTLTRKHWNSVLGGLFAVDCALVALVWWRRRGVGTALEALNIHWGLLLPLGAALAFVGVAWLIRRTNPVRRDAGQKLMLFGLLWLIVYDAAFVAGYVSFVAAGLLLLLLPVSYLSVQFMRWWGKVLSLSQKPQFKRAGV
jgi:4-hydroxybenzoate polyprenyltransferase